MIAPSILFIQNTLRHKQGSYTVLKMARSLGKYLVRDTGLEMARMFLYVIIVWLYIS